jgi:AbrB family looped-hinge helix DNA binding protein
MDDVLTATVSEKGQLVIPKSIREKMKLKRGDKLIVAFDENRLLLEKSSNMKKRIRDDFSDLVKASETSVGFWDNKYDEVWDHV